MNTLYPSGRTSFSNHLLVVGKRMLVLIMLVFAHTAFGQLSVNMSTTGPNPVPSGQDICFNLSYTWSSTTMDLNGAKIEIPIPLPLAGSSVSDVSLFNSPHIASSSYDPGTRKITWTMIDPLPAGSSGTISFCVHFPNGTTPPGSTVDLIPVFSGNGQAPATDSEPLTVDASPKYTVTKSITAAPACDQEATYIIRVNNDQGAGNLDLSNLVVTDAIPAGSTFIRASSGGTESGGTVTWNVGALAIGNSKVLRVTIIYPCGSFPDGTPVTNTANTTANIPGGGSISRSGSNMTMIAPANPVIISEKYSWSDYPSLDGGAGYTLYARNDGNVPVSNFVRLDTIPDKYYLTQLGLGYDDGGTQSTFLVEYQTNLNSTWRTWTNTPVSVPANPSAPDRVYLNPWDLGLDPNLGPEFVTIIRITMDNLPVGYTADNGSTYLSGYYSSPDKNGMAFTLPMPVNNTVHSEYTFNGTPTISSYTDPATIIGPSPKPRLYKGVNNGYSHQPGDQIEYVMCLTNNWDASQGLIEPEMADLLPPNMTFVPGSVHGTYGGLGSPNVTVTDNFHGTGRQLLSFSWNPGDSLKIGEEVCFYIYAKVTPGTPPGALDNTLYFIDAANPIINAFENTMVPDTNDINNNGLGMTEMVSASGNGQIYIIETTAIESYKLVKGECDTEFHKFPAVGKTVQGGTFQYKLFAYNVGNKPLTKIRFLDIDPWVGDVGVITHPTARESKYNPTFVSMDLMPPGMTIKYSTSTNPCRADLDPAISEPSGGCDAGTFSATPPSNMADVKSLLFDFGTTVLNPADSFEIRWTMRAPFGVVPGDVAWNSFGHRSESTTGTLVPPAEPIKVGVTVKSAQIGNFVWYDTNKDGIQDFGELGVDSVVVHLLDANMDPFIDPNTGQPVTDTTDANGFYNFYVSPGTFFVKFDIPVGNVASPQTAGSDTSVDSNVDPTGKSGAITVVDGDVNLTIDAGFYVVPCTPPTITGVNLAIGTCNTGTANNDATATVTGIFNADKADISIGSSYTGNAYSLATGTVSGGSVAFSGLTHNTQFTIRIFNGSDGCFHDTTVTTPTINCCALADPGIVVTCADNSTPNDPADDIYTFTINPTGVGTATTYSVTGDVSAANIPYGAASQVFGPFPISGGDQVITITDDGSALCQIIEWAVSAPVPCSNVTCTLPTAITLTQTAPTCNGGTPNNDGKITLTAVTDADKFGVSTGVTYSGTPDYAAATAFGTLPQDLQTAIPNTGATYTVRLFNGADDCFKDTTITVEPVACICSILTADLTTVCNDNGTAYTSKDDYYQITINPTADCGSTQYTVKTRQKSQILTFGPFNYGSPVTLANNYLIRHGNAFVTITDGNNSTVLTLDAPEPCAQIFDPHGYIYCEADGKIVPGGSVVVTPPAGGSITMIKDGSTGEYQFQMLGSGIYTIAYTPPSGYTFSTTTLPSTGGGLGGALDPTLGSVDNPDSSIYLFIGSEATNGYLVNSTPAANPYYFTIDWTDGDPNFFLNNFPLVCPVPPTCSIINADPQTTCHDNGTPNFASDDYFTVTLNPTGTNLGSGYSVNGSITAGPFTYGSPSAMPGQYLILGGPLNVLLSDEDNITCELDNVIITPPASCSSPLPCPPNVCLPVTVEKVTGGN